MPGLVTAQIIAEYAALISLSISTLSGLVA
ncbi:hypothetical protein HNP33_004166 [Comamonas odontotermitis]|uniref:Uncharacterized protein n=1 Tax=Comamonas odontotermitis TaxID=379895 RepID=A0ABR6RLH9_9BURK|nr:hypothetical protein [Comamonas odontotermitis]